ncbi:MAG: hypothetical protein A4E20_08890 [Nitrospira sp. SG-bin2]|uniref:hypothetical protein n=1 Tax=Nitrospira cf. moscoviensis SBR1015 TaxID=96242 RepID=UPI000A09FF8F|nr:hypothetical protein [Nitrospira cf. moscoviensis SBR1015]OQW35847.1 MAG: hypothetical protein A4E20_08890 [Nitrospira sp. SG-bin2]
MADLFTAGDDERRRKLIALGCYETGGKLAGRFLWRLPSGIVVDEEEAFTWLARKEEGIQDA